MLVSLSCSVLAYDTFNDHVLNGGVGNYGYNKRYFYIASSASGYTTDINYAMNDWIYTTSRLGITTPISWRRTYTQSSSVMDFHVTSRYDTGIFAATTFWRYSTQYNPYYSNWGWGKIEIETDLNSFSSWVKEGVIAHEMGHVMGLDHNSNLYSIMYPYADAFRVNNAQADDCNGINHLY